MRFLKSNLWGQVAFGFALGAVGLFAVQHGESGRTIAHHVASIAHGHA